MDRRPAGTRLGGRHALRARAGGSGRAAQQGAAHRDLCRPRRGADRAAHRAQCQAKTEGSFGGRDPGRDGNGRALRRPDGNACAHAHAEPEADRKAGLRRLHPAGQRHAPAHAGGRGGPSRGSSAALPATRSLRATAAFSRRRRSRPISRRRAGITARCPARRSITIRSRRPSARTPTSSQITRPLPGGIRIIEHMPIEHRCAGSRMNMKNLRSFGCGGFS